MEKAPERIEVEKARLAEFERELHNLLADAAAGKYDSELRARGISLPPGMTGDAITTESIGEQPVAGELLVILAIKYSPLVVPIGLDLWTWAWPKLRDYFDGAARDSKSRN
jgi:hypothetical protein